MHLHLEQRQEDPLQHPLEDIASDDHRQDQYSDLGDLPEHLLAEISHFFEVYKDLEPGKYVKVGGWHSRDEALAVVAEAQANFPG